MRWFHSRSLNGKLMILFTATAAAALAVALLVIWISEFRSYRSTLLREMITISRMMADSSKAAAAFDDVRAAREAITTLRAEPRIERGCVLKRSGEVLAEFSRDGKPRGCGPAPDGVEARFQANRLDVFSPIVLEGERVGAVCLEVDLTEMYDRLRFNAWLGVCVMLLSALVALALSSRLQRVISGPILHLTEVAARVSAGDYMRRAEHRSDDELGALIRRFNEMMEQIHSRDVALQRAQDELETRVRERTSELQNEIAERKAIESHLIEAKAAAEESNQAKSAFLANMSHELRTPLNAILGYSELLEEEAPERGAEFIVPDLRRIQYAGRHLLALISDVLDLSKIEAGRVELQIEPVPIAELVAQAGETIRPMATKNKNRLVLDDSGSDGFVLVDAFRFRQSLLNLLSNACKFTENGEVALSVERRAEADRDWVYWHVRDTGIGIAPESLHKLFQSFSQVDSSTTRKYGGTGLGLAISQRFCNMMGGQITVESEPGVGSTFTIRVPAAGDPASTSPVSP